MAKSTAFGTQVTNYAGGDILGYFGEHKSDVTPFVNWDLVNQYNNLVFVEMGISALLVTIAVLIGLRIFNIKSVFKMKGLSTELENIRKLRDRDAYVMTANRIMKFITDSFEKTVLRSNKANKDFIDYNLKRANIRVIGGFRPMVMEEFYSIIKLMIIIFCIISLGIGLAGNIGIGLALMLFSIWAGLTLPMIVVRLIVQDRNRVVQENFFDMYCKLHHSLAAGGVTPINKLMQIYAKTTDNPEMLRFVDNCCNLIETYNEYAATMLIADDYREIAEVGKLMRLVKQQADGADILDELIGFRAELVDQEKYRLSKMVDRDILKVKATFNILTILLGQAVISAMSLYLPDLGMLSVGG